MKATISDYKRGIASLHNLMDMLYVSLMEVMPSVKLARTGAYGWRGYNIRRYKNLACGHYFCQIYPSLPTVLLMEEFVNYDGMYYPWRVDFDLIHINFFGSDVNVQKALIVGFYQEAVREALEWQVSAKRQSIVPQKIWGGKKYTSTTQTIYPKKIYQVSREYITALELQDKLFALLAKVVAEQVVAIGMPKPYIKYNIIGWNYRGFWMKLRTNEPENVIPEGSFPYHFKIDLYDNPTLLRYIGNGEEKILDLAESYYFNLDDENQQKTLSEFLKPIIMQMK